MTTLPLNHVTGINEPSLPPAMPLLQVPTFRNWMRTIVWTLVVVGLFGAAYFFDKYQGWFEFQQRRAYEYRLFKNPATIAMRAFGIPHFLIAVLFLMSSRRMKEARNRLIFAGLFLASIGICWIFARWGAHHCPFAIFLFYFYFIIHGFRDDSYFYKTYGDMPAIARHTHERIMVILQLLSVGLLFSLLWPAYAQLSETNPRFADPILGTFFPADWPFVLRLGSMFGPMVLIATTAIWRLARQFPGGPVNFWRTHRPVLMVYLLTICIILLAPAVGPWTFDLYILMHFIGWYLIALFLIDRHPPKQPVTNWWGWMRTTRTGFITLHFSLVAVTLVLLAVSVYGFGRDCTLDKVIGAPGFYYWTIFHVTLSFVPR